MDEARPALPGDRYVVADLLGEGGMAKVWRAWHVERGVWCAVKVMSERYAKSPDARRRFLDEGRTLTRLSHRNVIQAWEAVDADPLPYIVMEIADAGSIHDWVQRHGAMLPKMAVDVAVQICKGLGAAHRIGVIHRDVKPHNVLVNRKGTCKISDFGIAKLDQGAEATTVPNATTHHEAMGTLGYMAPEQRSDPQSVDARIDVYGIGATLYTLLTGRVVTNLFKAMQDEPETLKDIPGVLVPVLAKATAYKPEVRYQTVNELARALHTVWEQLPDKTERMPSLTAHVRAPEPPPPPGMIAKAALSSLPPSNLQDELGRRGRPTIDDLVSTPIPPTTPNSSRRRAGPAAAPPPDKLTFGRPDDDEAEPTPPPVRTRPLVVASALVGFAVLLVMAPVLHVRSAATAAAAAQEEYATVLFRELSVIDELGQLGADRKALEARFEAVRAAGDLPSYLAATERYLEDLERASATTTGGSERAAVLVADRVRTIRAAHDAWVGSVDAWRARATGFPGVIATRLRPALAPDLPPR